MTGLFVRIRRDDGSIQSVEFDQMTDDEMQRFAGRQPLHEGWNWAVVLAKWIRDRVTEIDGDTRV